MAFKLVKFPEKKNWILGYLTKNIFLQIIFDSRINFERKYFKKQALYVASELRLVRRKFLKLERGSFIVLCASFSDFSSIFPENLNCHFNHKSMCFQYFNFKD